MFCINYRVNNLISGENMKKLILFIFFAFIVSACSSTSLNLGVTEEEEQSQQDQEAATEGDTGSITITVTEVGSKFFKAARIQDVTSFHVLVTKDGQTIYDGAELEIKNIPLGIYALSLEAKDTNGTVMYRGEAADIEVKKNETTSVTIYSGDTLTLTANHGEVEGTLTYVWYRNETLIDGQNTKSLTLDTSSLSGDQRFLVYVELSNTISCGPGAKGVSITDSHIFIDSITAPEDTFFYFDETYNFRINALFTPESQNWSNSTYSFLVDNPSYTINNQTNPDFILYYPKTLYDTGTKLYYKVPQYTFSVHGERGSSIRDASHTSLSKPILHGFLANHSDTIPQPNGAWAGAFTQEDQLGQLQPCSNRRIP